MSLGRTRHIWNEHACSRTYLARPAERKRWLGDSGIIARCLARLIAFARPLWCLEQVPVLRLA